MRGFMSAFVAAFVLLGVGQAVAGELDFILANKTGMDIHEIYVSPSDHEEWGPDVLDVDILENGASTKITFSPKADAKLWDLKVKDENGKETIWTRLDLSKIETLTLTCENNQPKHQEELDDEDEDEDEDSDK